MTTKILGKLVPEFQEVKVKDKYYRIGELSLKQTIQLSREIIRVIAGFSKNNLEEIKGGKSNLEDLLSFFGFLNEDEIARIIGLILKEENIKFLKENLSLNVSTEILAIVCEKNNFSMIVKNVQRMMTAIQKKTCSSSLSK